MFDSAIARADLDSIGEPSPRPTTADNDFRSHVKGGWENVFPAVRARMDKLLTSPTITTFEGAGFVRRSTMGWIFAQLARLLGAPLVWKRGEDVKTVVRVVPTKGGFRCWHRLFIFPDGTEQLVQTSKVVDPRLGFLDVVGAEGERALATQMKVRAHGKSLHFRSTVYLLRFPHFTLRIPSIFTPGTLTAEHRDEGNGWFRYTLKFDHPLWGETFHQDGMFRMLE